MPLSLDTFAVAAALGAAGVTGDRRRTLSVIFASCEAGMPLVGLILGAALGEAIGDIGSFLASAALVGLGGYILLAGEAGEERRVARLARSKGVVVLAAGLAVSLDELAIGFVFGLLNVPVVPALMAIAIQAVAASQVGFAFGERVHEGVREGAERLAGIVLVLLGLLLFASRALTVVP